MLSIRKHVMFRSFFFLHMFDVKMYFLFAIYAGDQCWSQMLGRHVHVCACSLSSRLACEICCTKTINVLSSSYNLCFVIVVTAVTSSDRSISLSLSQLIWMCCCSFFWFQASHGFCFCDVTIDVLSLLLYFLFKWTHYTASIRLSSYFQ